MISWKISDEDFDLVGKIVTRAAKLYRSNGVSFNRQNVVMDLIACNANGTPLDFKKMLAADDFNLAHDIGGIDRHMNRETGKLEGFFRPRCTLRENA